MPIQLLRIRLLGEFQIVQGDESLSALNSARQQALLAYLLLQRATPCSRQQLAFLFWPESSEVQAQTNLRQLLYTVRQRLPNAEQFLAIDDRVVQWRADAPFTLDVADFEHALEHAEKSKGAECLRSLEQAVAIYAGDLLPELYEDWVLSIRSRLSQRFVGAMEQLVHLHEERRNLKTAIAYAQRLLRYDPIHESIYRQIMRLYALDGDRAAALRIYHTCATVLERELGVEPSATTQEVYQRLLKTATPIETNHPSPLRSALALRLVGRQSEWEILQQAWHLSIRGRAHCVMLSGEAGIGKTRLAEELLHWAEQQGISTARTRAYAMEGSLPYAPVIEWLRSEMFQSVLANLEAVWLSELARLLPELREQAADLPTAEVLSEGWQRVQLVEALVRAISAHRDPFLLLLDDLQWCDLETLDWLYYLLQFKTKTRLLIVVTLRAEEVDDQHPVSRLRLKLQSTAQLTMIELFPLAAEETALLACDVAQRKLDHTFLRQLYLATEGNPLFVVETMREQIASNEAAQWKNMPAISPLLSRQTTALPPKVQAVIQARLARLSPPARELAELAAVVGRSFTFTILLHASDSTSDTLVRSLDELWQRRIVREQGAGSYDFSHDRIREVATAQISLTRRQLLHRRVAEALEQVHNTTIAEISGMLASHYEQAGMTVQAITYYWQAVENARQRFATRDMITYARKGLALLTTMPDTYQWQRQRLDFNLALGSSLPGIEDPMGLELRQIYLQSRWLSQQLGQKLQQYVAQRGLWGYYLNRGFISEACTQAMQNLALAQELQHPRCLRDAYTNMGLAAFVVGEFAQAVTHFKQAISYDEAAAATPQIAAFGFEFGIEAPLLCASALCLLGYPEQAQRLIEGSLQYHRMRRDPYTQTAALYFASQFYLIVRDLPTLETVTAELVESAARYDLFGFLFDGTILLEWSKVLQIKTTGSIDRMQHSLELYLKSDPYQLTYFYGLVAEANGAASQYTEGLRLLDLALTRVDGSGERFWAGELYRLQGEMRWAQGEAGAEVSFQTALTIAREQQAKWLELRTAVSLGRCWQLQGKYSEAQQLVAGIYNWFSEGFATSDLCAARELLAQSATAMESIRD